jgi:hypothetical protein
MPVVGHRLQRLRADGRIVQPSPLLRVALADRCVLVSSSHSALVLNLIAETLPSSQHAS